MSEAPSNTETTKKQGKIRFWPIFWSFMVLGLFIGTATGIHKADIETARAHQRWGNALQGQVYWIDSIADHNLAAAHIVYTDGNRVQRGYVTRLVSNRWQAGQSVRLWQSTTGEVFVAGSYRVNDSGFFTKSPWREDPWPRTQGAFFGQVLGWLFLGLIVSTLTYLAAVVCSKEFSSEKKKNTAAATPQSEATSA